MVLTKGGRPAYVVNVEAYLYQGDRWLLIERGLQEAHAPGRLAAPGGKVEADGADAIAGILEQTAVREALEEVGVDLNAVTLSYVESAFFVTDDGDPVVNVVFAGPLPDDAEPRAASADEVASVRMMTVAQVLADDACPPWTRRALKGAELLRTAGRMMSDPPGRDADQTRIMSIRRTHETPFTCCDVLQAQAEGSAGARRSCCRDGRIRRSGGDSVRNVSAQGVGRARTGARAHR